MASLRTRGLLEHKVQTWHKIFLKLARSQYVAQQLHSLKLSLPLHRIRYLFSEEEKKSISAKFIHGFLRSMWVHSEGLSGPQFIPVNVFEGELPLMLFCFPPRSKSILELSRPACHTRGTSLQSSVTHMARGCAAAADVEERQSGWLGLLWGSLLLELIVNPIKAGNSAYWFTPLNTQYKQIQREYVMCRFAHKWLSCPQNIHIIWCSRWKTAVPHTLLIGCNHCNLNSHDLSWLLDCFHDSCTLHNAALKDVRCDPLKHCFKDILFAPRIDFKHFLHTGYISGQLDIFGHLQIIFSSQILVL